MRDRAAIRARVEGITKVVTLPAAVHRITAKINSGQASAADIAEDISQDPVLTANVLKLVNSGLYGFRQPVTTVTHALVLLGLSRVKSLVFTASVMDLVSSKDRTIAGLWQHSLATARAAVVIAEFLNVASPEEHALAGLLHDMGKVIIAQAFPSEHARIRAVVQATARLQVDAELEVLGVTHAEVGAWLLRKWSLPDRLVYPIAYHHAFHPQREHADGTAVVHVADILARAMGIGNPGDGGIPSPHPDALALLNLPTAAIEAVCLQLDADRRMGAFN